MKVYQRLSLSREYFFFAFVILIISITLIWLTWSTYDDLEKTRNRRYSIESTKIDEALEETFTYTANFIRLIGIRIAASEKTDAKSVVSVLLTTIDADKIKEDILPWTLFEFVNSQNYAIASTAGVIPKPLPVNYNRRPWVKEARIQPWHLHIANPDIGIVSGEHILPGGYGITDRNKKFLGIIAVGFNIEKLKNKIKRSLAFEDTKFVLLTSDLHFITSSFDESLGSDLMQEFKKCEPFIQDFGQLKCEVKYGTVIYKYYKKFYPYNYLIFIGEDTKDMQQEFKKLVIPQFIKTLSLGGLFLIVLYIFRKQIITPITLLSKYTRSISEGDFNIVIPKEGSHEIANLAEALEMVKDTFQRESLLRIQLAQAHSQVKNINESLEQKVQERTAELEQALKAKTEFLNNISHEIRTPMQGFDGIAQGLVSNWYNLSENDKFIYIQQIAKSSSRLSSLLGHLLDLSKFIEGKITLDFEKIELNQVIEEMIDEAKTLYTNDKQITINFTPTENSLIVADKERIIQVLRNLFVNAIKFNQKNAIINVFLKNAELTYDDQSKSDAYHFIIEDQGIGIPENELEAVFTPFFQSSRTKTRAGGTGLGLSIAREIIEAHHGRIWAENKIDQGASFNFIIPVSQDKYMNGHKIIAENDIEMDKTSIKSAAILIIDDEETCLMSIELLLFGSGYNLYKFHEGYAGLDYLKSHYNLIDLIILDLMIPDIYGLNLITEIKKDPMLAGIPIILQTGSSDTAEIEKAFELGINFYIKKPYQRHTVIMEIEKALSKKY